MKYRLNSPAVIRRIEIYRLKTPSTGDGEEAGVILVRIAARQENELYEGWGEGVPGNPSGTGQTTSVIADDLEKRIGPFLIGKEFSSAEDVAGLIKDAEKLRRWSSTALAAVDSAMFDLLGKMLKAPVYKLVRDAAGIEESEMDLSLPTVTVNEADELPDVSLVDRRNLSSIISEKGIDGFILRLNLFGGFTFLISLLKEIASGDKKRKLVFKDMHKTGAGAMAELHGFAASVKYCIGKPVFADNPTDVISNVKAFESETSLSLILSECAGLGFTPDFGAVEKSAEKGAVIFENKGQILLRSFPYIRNKPDFRKVEEVILSANG